MEPQKIIVGDKEDMDIVKVSDETENLKSLIHVIRGKQVMIDSDLAMLYQIETKNLNKAVSRNIARFPDDFRFKLSKEEYDDLKFHSGTSKVEKGGSGGR